MGRKCKIVEVWALAEVVDYLGLSKARIVQLANQPDFPQPITVLTVGRIWNADDIREYARKRRALYADDDNASP